VTDEPTDAELLARIKTDPAAVELIFRRYRHLVLAYAARRCSDPADVLDLVADTFLAVLENGGGFDPRRGSAPAWILGVAHRQWVRTTRRDSRNRELARRHAGQRHLATDDITRIEEQIDASRERTAVEEAMARLPAGHREVLWLIGHEGLTSEQAALAADLHPAVFRVRLHRAQRALQRQLDARTTAHPENQPLPAARSAREVHQ
jgi:RNA polymerase sigma factor (sigma-70 family)